MYLVAQVIVEMLCSLVALEREAPTTVMCTVSEVEIRDVPGSLSP